MSATSKVSAPAFLRAVEKITGDVFGTVQPALEALRRVLAKSELEFGRGREPAYNEMAGICKLLGLPSGANPKRTMLVKLIQDFAAIEEEPTLKRKRVSPAPDVTAPGASTAPTPVESRLVTAIPPVAPHQPGDPWDIEADMDGILGYLEVLRLNPEDCEWVTTEGSMTLFDRKEEKFVKISEGAGRNRIRHEFNMYCMLDDALDVCCVRDGFFDTRDFTALSLYSVSPMVPVSSIGVDEKIISKVMARLAKLHRLGLVHGDPHNDNIYIDTRDCWVLFIDLGCAVSLENVTKEYQWCPYTLDSLFGGYSEPQMRDWLRLHDFLMALVFMCPSVKEGFAEFGKRFESLHGKPLPVENYVEDYVDKAPDLKMMDLDAAPRLDVEDNLMAGLLNAIVTHEPRV